MWGDRQGKQGGREGMGEESRYTRGGKECQGSADKWKRQLRRKERRKRDLKGN